MRKNNVVALSASKRHAAGPIVQAGTVQFQECKLDRAIALVNPWYDLPTLRQALLNFSESQDYPDAIFSKPTHRGDSKSDAEAGRGKVVRLKTQAGFSLVFRQYRRGGMMRHLLDKTFFSLPSFLPHQTRPFQELSMLAVLRTEGVHVPMPVAAVVRPKAKGFLYEGILITEEVPHARNLLEEAQVPISSAEQARMWELACRAVGQEARRVLLQGILHVDLHLGNVLLDAGNQVYLIDFDKARRIRPDVEFEWAISQLRSRWRRSIEKHSVVNPKLSVYAEAPFVEGLLGHL